MREAWGVRVGKGAAEGKINVASSARSAAEAYAKSTVYSSSGESREIKVVLGVTFQLTTAYQNYVKDSVCKIYSKKAINRYKYDSYDS